MPLGDLGCCDCGYTYTDKYFVTVAEYEAAQQTIFECPACGGDFKVLTPNPCMIYFRPFDHMTKDGRTHRITSEFQRHEMMRRYGLETHPYNDTMEAKVDPREFQQLAREEKRDFPEHYRKLREKVKIAPVKEAEALAARAQATKFETVRA